jgi:hypothetical protein
MSTPRIVATVYVLCGVLVFGWMAHQAPWWAAIVSALVVNHTRGCVRRVQNYEAWLARWQAFGEEEEEAPRRVPEARAGKIRKANAAGARGGMKTENRKAWRALTWAAALFLTAPLWMRGPVSNGVVLLWIVAAVFLLCRLFACGWRRVFRPRVRRIEKIEAKAAAQSRESGQVTVLLEPASSSPSRGEAERQLPNYCAALLKRG